MIHEKKGSYLLFINCPVPFFFSQHRSPVVNTKSCTRFILLFVSALVVFMVSAATAAPKAPKEVAGFVLGSKVTDYPDIEYSNFLKEVVVYDWHGFNKGIISYGVCAIPGEIIKIKMKYTDSSKKYFKLLLKKYKKQFGKPTEWKGDSFGILHIWKWKFLDENNNRVHLILQYNTKNLNENIGNMVKLYYPDRIIQEQKCFSMQCNKNISQAEKNKRAQRSKSDWKYLIPR